MTGSLNRRNTKQRRVSAWVLEEKLLATKRDHERLAFDECNNLGAGSGLQALTL